MLRFLKKLLGGKPHQPVVDLGRLNKTQADLPAGANRSEREPTYTQCVVTLPDGRKHDAVLLDVSDTGAKLAQAAAMALPKHLHLSIPSRNYRGRVEVIWQRGAEFGVTFLD